MWKENVCFLHGIHSLSKSKSKVKVTKLYCHIFLAPFQTSDWSFDYVTCLQLDLDTWPSHVTLGVDLAPVQLHGSFKSKSGSKSRTNPRSIHGQSNDAIPSDDAIPAGFEAEDQFRSPFCSSWIVNKENQRGLRKQLPKDWLENGWKDGKDKKFTLKIACIGFYYFC